jgi:fructose-1-phosphate kinase PfkB-like protein
MSAPAQPMVYTLTGNLLAERTLDFERWAPGRTQRATAETFQVGGKGINVAKMLTRLGVPNTALCFTGGAPGVECERWLQSRGIGFQSFASAAATRVGLVVRYRSGAHAETTFLGPDAAPGAEAWQACAAFLDSIADGQVLALCGSFPGWTRTEAAGLRAALARWAARGFFVVDTYGPPLADLANRPLDLLKINRDELQTLSSPDIGALPRSLRHVIVTDGPRAIQVRDANGTTATFMPPPVQEVSATGSGDVFLACVIASLHQRGTSLTEAVAFAIPHASANAAHPGIAEYPMPPPDFRINALR